MWLNRFKHNDLGQIKIYLTEREKVEKDEEKIYYSLLIGKDWLRMNKYLGKGLILKKNINYFKIKSDGSNFVFYLEVNEDNEWNEMMKMKHPILWNIGLVTKYEKYEKKLFESNDYQLVKKLIKSIEKLKYSVIMGPA
ncbi:MAG: hypothetical protein R2941_20820 [Desulfobacterales bacterium]